MSSGRLIIPSVILPSLRLEKSETVLRSQPSGHAKGIHRVAIHHVGVAKKPASSNNVSDGIAFGVSWQRRRARSGESALDVTEPVLVNIRDRSIESIVPRAVDATTSDATIVKVNVRRFEMCSAYRLKVH